MKLLVVIDMQKDFVNGSLGSDQAKNVLPFIIKKIKNCIELGYKIAFTMDTHDEDYLQTSEGKKLPVPHCIKGTEGWQLCDEITDSIDMSDVKIFTKPTFGCCQLGEFARDFETVELVGVCTSICVVSNALLIKAFSPETEVIVHEKGCACVTEQTHSNALETMKNCHILIEKDS